MTINRMCMGCDCEIPEADEFTMYETPRALIFYCQECAAKIGDDVGGFIVDCIPHKLPSEPFLFANNCETCEFARENGDKVIVCVATSFGRKAYKGHGKCGSYLKEGLLELDGRGQ